MTDSSFFGKLPRLSSLLALPLWGLALLSAPSGCDSDAGGTALHDAGTEEQDAEGPPRSVSCRVLGMPGLMLLPEARICDGTSDCHDGSDEISCPDVFLCEPICGVSSCAIDGSEVRAVPNAKRCDRKADCPLADDEKDCPDSDVLFCDANDEGIQRVYEPSQMCDGRADCYWAEDERDCPTFFECRHDGPGVDTLPPEKVCDGVWDCPNDEYDCPDLVDPYTCPGGSQIARKFVCDGYEDCDGNQHGAEELDPSCHQFRCTHSSSFFDRWTRSFDDPWYIDQSKVCDGKRDCYTGNDEEKCP